MSTLANALTTKEKVKSYIGISDSASDTVIDMLIDQATAFIEGYCGGRKFKSQNYIDYVDTRGTDRLFFEQYPVTALTEVAYRGGTITSPTWTVYDANNYMLYAKAGYVKFFFNLPNSSQGIKLTYTAGYLIDFTKETDVLFHTLPNDLVMACTELVGYKYNKRQSQGISSQSTEGQSVTFKDLADDMPVSVKQVLGAYQTFRYAI